MLYNNTGGSALAVIMYCFVGHIKWVCGPNLAEFDTCGVDVCPNGVTSNSSNSVPVTIWSISGKFWVSTTNFNKQYDWLLSKESNKGTCSVAILRVMHLLYLYYIPYSIFYQFFCDEHQHLSTSLCSFFFSNSNFFSFRITGVLPNIVAKHTNDTLEIQFQISTRSAPSWRLPVFCRVCFVVIDNIYYVP